MRIWKEIWDYAKMIIIVVVIVTLVNSVVLINAKIPSESMEKTIMTGDRIFGFRLAYGLNLDFFGHEISKKIKDPERFDIVIFKYPDDESKLFIKRVIGLPGEKVQIKDGKVYINGKVLEESGGFEPIRSAGLASEAITLGEDEYFVLGDNRNNSADSREPSVGTILRQNMIGRAVFRIWPLDGVGFLN